MERGIDMDCAKISRAAANEAVGLITEYLVQGGAGFDDELLADFFHAICRADQITIEDRDDGAV
jgi:hypothetical protein